MEYAIIGGGIGGLTTALAFEKVGISYQLFEKVPIIKEVGAGIWLAPNALQVLDWLGLLQEIKLNGNPINRITLAKSDLTTLSDSFQSSVIDKFGYCTYAIHRAKLLEILFNKIPKSKVHLGKSFKSFRYNDDGKIKIHFADKSSIETHYLIGADGINSKIRNQLFPESKTRDTGQICWRGIADYELDDDFKNRGVELWGNQIRFGISKVAKRQVYWFAVELKSNNRFVKENPIKDKLLKDFEDFIPLVYDIISSTPSKKIIQNNINDIMPLTRWHKKNICLLGDAAHATTPNIGQGGAQAIEDAYFLSNLVSKNNEDSFEKFYYKRHKKVNNIVKQSYFTGNMAHWKYGTSIRNFIIKNTPNSIIEKKMMEMYEVENFTS